MSWNVPSSLDGMGSTAVHNAHATSSLCCHLHAHGSLAFESIPAMGSNQETVKGRWISRVSTATFPLTRRRFARSFSWWQIQSSSACLGILEMSKRCDTLELLLAYSHAHCLGEITGLVLPNSCPLGLNVMLPGQPDLMFPSKPITGQKVKREKFKWKKVKCKKSNDKKSKWG